MGKDNDGVRGWGGGGRIRVGRGRAGGRGQGCATNRSVRDLRRRISGVWAMREGQRGRWEESIARGLWGFTLGWIREIYLRGEEDDDDESNKDLFGDNADEDPTVTGLSASQRQEALRLKSKKRRI